VGHRVHVGGGDGGPHGGCVDDRGAQQLVRQGRGRTRPRRPVESESGPLQQHPTGQGVAIASQTGREETDDDIPHPHPGGAQGLIAFDRPDGEADQIELAGLHHTGVLGHLPAQQGGTDLAAPLGHPGHQIGHLGRVHRPGRDVVEEEQRLGALAHEVVHAHGDQIDADGAEPSQGPGDQRLGAHAVRGRHQHRVAISAGVQGEQTAEAPKPADHLGTQGGGHQRPDPIDGPLAGLDVHAGIGVGGRGGGIGRGQGGFRCDSGHAGEPLATPLSAGLAPSCTGTGTGTG
jgi:hypothetical protein